MFSLISLPVVIVQLFLRCGRGHTKSFLSHGFRSLDLPGRNARLPYRPVRFASRIQKELAVEFRRYFIGLPSYIIHGELTRGGQGVGTPMSRGVFPAESDNV